MTFTTNWKQSHELPSSLVAPSAPVWEGQIETAGVLQRMGWPWKKRKIEIKTAWRELLCSEAACKRNVHMVQRYIFKNLPNSGYKVMIQFYVVCSITGIFRIWLWFWFFMKLFPLSGFLPLSPSNSLTYQRLKSHWECEIKLKCSFIYRWLRIPSENKSAHIMKFYL